MAQKLFVGGLPFSTSNEQLRALFAETGEVTSATVVTDRDTGRSRGFGFVEMNDDNQARAACEALNQQEFEGRRLTVNEARPQERREGGFSRGDRGGSRGETGGNRQRRERW